MLKSALVKPLPLALFASAFWAMPVTAQSSAAHGDATLYSNPGYNGSAFRVTGPRTSLNLRWRVESIRIASGRWQLCERSNYQGRCVNLDRSVPGVQSNAGGMIVQSMRPLGNGNNNGNGGSGGGYGGGDGSSGNAASLRGMAAEFFPYPMSSGRRVTACVKGDAMTSCGTEQADRFCAANGWRTAERQNSQVINNQRYLADVLCTADPRPR